MNTKFLLCDLEVSSKLSEKIIDNFIAKFLPYSRKDKSIPDKIIYRYLMIPYDSLYDPNTDEYSLTEDELLSHIKDAKNLRRPEFKELCKVFYPLRGYEFKINIVLTELGFDSYAITYTDGSKTPKISNAGYGVVKLKSIDDTHLTKEGVEEWLVSECDFNKDLIPENSDLEVLESYIETNSTLSERYKHEYKHIYNENYLTHLDFSYDGYHGSTEGNGTNNIGELTAIKKAIELSDDKPLQIIISDNVYSINTYREYIYDWEKNNYRNAKHEEIKNKNLIIDTQKMIRENHRSTVFLFCWIKGHKKYNFNEIADSLAKISTMGE